MKLHFIGGGALAALLSACAGSPVYDPYDWRVTWTEVTPAASRLADAEQVTLRAPSAGHGTHEGG